MKNSRMFPYYRQIALCLFVLALQRGAGKKKRDTEKNWGLDGTKIIVRRGKLFGFRAKS